MTKNSPDQSTEPGEEQRTPPESVDWIQIAGVVCMGLSPCLAFFLACLSIFQDWTWVHVLPIPVMLLLFAAYPYFVKIRAVKSCIDGRHEFEFENWENRLCAVRGKPEISGGGIRTTQGHPCMWYHRSLSEYKSKIKKHGQAEGSWEILDEAKYGRAFKLGLIHVQNEITGAFNFKVSYGYWPHPSLKNTFIKGYPDKADAGARKEELFYVEVLEDVIILGELQKRHGQWQLKRHWLGALTIIDNAELYLAKQLQFCSVMGVIAGLTALFYVSRLAAYSLYAI